jgi:hypothetical protein
MRGSGKVRRFDEKLRILPVAPIREKVPPRLILPRIIPRPHKQIVSLGDFCRVAEMAWAILSVWWCLLVRSEPGVKKMLIQVLRLMKKR